MQVGSEDGAGDSILRSKARAVAESVWNEHRKTAVMTFDTISDEARDILIDCCLEGMCVGIISGSDLVRPDQVAAEEPKDPHPCK